MHVPTLDADPRGPRRSLARAHEVDAAWNGLLMDAEFGFEPTYPVLRSRAYRAGELRLTVQCRRHVASVRRAFANGFPPYAAVKVAHP